MVTLDPGVDYDSDDVIVKAYPWAFVVKEAAKPVESVAIEAATAEPGQKRTRTRAKS